MKDDEYYKLVKAALNKYNFKYDDDILQEIVTSTANKMKNFDELRGNKSTFIYLTVKTEYLQIFKKRNANKRIANQLCTSLNQTIKSDENEKITLIELQRDYKEDIEYNLEKENILKEITPLIEKPLKLWLEGKTQLEIKDILDLKSQSQVSRTINNNIIKIKNYCKAKGIEFKVKEMN